MNQNPRKIFEAGADIEYTMNQKSALLLIDTFLSSPDLFFLLAGYAGTGKTTIAENIARYAKACMIAPTNAAVKRLREKIESKDIGPERFSTIHSALYGSIDEKTGEWKKGAGLNHAKVYVVDECSMIDQKLLDDLCEEASKRNVKLIFMGDNFQLEPIGRDPKIFNWEKSDDRFEEHWKAQLTDVVRNKDTVLEVATHLRVSGKPEILNLNTPTFNLLNMFTTELKFDIENDGDYIILTSTNKLRMNFNSLVRNVRFEEDAANPVNDFERAISVANIQFLNGEQYIIRHPKLIDEFTLQINVGSDAYPKKRLIRFLYYEHEVEGKQGRFYTLFVPGLDIPSLYQHSLMKNFKFKNDNRFVKMISPRFGAPYPVWNKRVNIATYGYATSVHKSQGSEWDSVYIDASWLSNKWDNARWLYTAITRSKRKVEIKRSNYFKVINGK